MVRKTEETTMLPGLAQLESTPEILRILLFGLSDEEASWKPAPDRWSIAEVIEHLSHVEAHVFRARIDQMVQETLPEIKDYDQDALVADGQYSGRDIEDSFDHWEDQRDSNVEYLRTLKDDLLNRQGRHEKLGIVTAAEVLNAWAFHDLGHLRQVIEILRAFRHFPKMGPFQSNYRIHP